MNREPDEPFYPDGAGEDELRRALRESEARFRNVIEKNADGMVIVGRDGTIRFVNPAAETLLGRRAAELLDGVFGIPVAPGETTEIEIHPPGGRLRFAEMRVVDTEWEGRPAYLASLRDVTERRQADEALRQSEERFRLLVEGVKDYGIIMLDPEGLITSWNTGAERLLGYGEQEILGQPFDRLFLPEEARSGEPRQRLAVAANEGQAEAEGWRIRKDGSQFWASCEVSAVRDDLGRLLGFAKVIHDTTERKRLEQELRRRADELAEADRQKNDYLAMLAHELRNPLAPVLNALQILRLADDPAMTRRAQDMIERQVRHMARLVDDLLDVSRITRGKIRLRREPLDLCQAIERALESVRPLAESKRIALGFERPSCPLRVEADPTRIEQVMTNLFNNAVKYTEPEGHVRVVAGHEGSDAVVRVLDDGIGIASEMLPRVFDLFTQVDRSLDRSEGGLGIGLTLVRSLVELHNGRVEARSEGLGRGSEFVVRLPALTEPEQIHNQHDTELRLTSNLRRVLVVDDNRHAAESLAVLLRLWGHEATLAHDGPATLEAVETSRPQVVLLDIGLPYMNGYEVARRLRRRRDLPDLVLVAMTGYGQDEDRQRSIEAGFDHHLVKPIDLEALRSLLGETELFQPRADIDGPG